MIIKTSAPGKIHLSGEHSVVYGQPALLSAIDKRLLVTLVPRRDKIINCKSSNLVVFGINKIYQILARKPKAGFDLKIDSQIPSGSGLGSSAALAVALTAAILVFETKKFNKKMINKIAYEIEKKQHGRPSGGDNTIITYGGLIKFQKKAGSFQFSQLKLIKNNLPEFLLINSGQPRESTGEMIAFVREKFSIFPPKADQSWAGNFQFSKIIKNMAKMTEKIIKDFKKGEFRQLKKLMDENEELLEKLGVVGNKAKVIIQLIKQIGGAAKICGAGGIKSGSGMLIAHHKNLMKLKQLLESKNIEFLNISLAQEGVKIETN